MMTLFVLVSAVTLLEGQESAGSIFDLREKVENAKDGGLSTDELGAFAQEAFALAQAASSRGKFWSAIGFIGELCDGRSLSDVEEIRAEAMAILVQRDSDTLRWSSLVTERFIPDFDHIPRDQWSQEVASYDRLLDQAVEGGHSDRVRAEILYAKAMIRIHINRRWDWLGERERQRAISILEALKKQFGALPVPGDSDLTVAERARQHFHELKTLYFGAPAPPTSGVDLKGQPLDVVDFEGKVIVLDFWTTFCRPCLALVPGVRELMDKLSDEPVIYLGVNGDTDRLQGLATATRVGMTWRNFWDGPQGSAGPLATTWNVPALGWPSVFVLDGKGRIRYKLRGKDQVESRLEGAIRKLLEEGVGEG